MQKKTSLYIKNLHGDNMPADLRFIPSDERKPLVIFSHGFKGFKDWGCFPYLLEKLADSGFFCVSFNFSYNGTGGKPEDQSEFSRLDLFAKNTFTRELDDLGSVIDFLDNNRSDFEYDFDKLCLLGHSRGGGISILKAGEDKRVKKLAVLASVSSFDRYSVTLKEKWKEAGYFEVLNARTNQVMRMNYGLIEDLEKNLSRLDIRKAASSLDIPVLFVHGMQDITVDYSNAEDLNSRSNKNITRLELIENTGHTFGAVHPFQGTTPALEEVIGFLNGFFGEKE
jgi:pimeloyl-ACP methyl ester carboxylesterase